MKSEKAINAKTGRLLAKNLIIAFVLVAVCALSIWAWFSNYKEANADGMSVKAKATGVEVSWDNINFYHDLTAQTDAEMKADTTGKTGMAKFLEENDTHKLKLVTGNGLNFFEPYLNRRTGEPLKETSGIWKGVEIKNTNSSGRYVDIPVYFRGTDAGSVWLAGDSRVAIKSSTDRLSDYGDFSRDYIAAASRVAFLTETGDAENPLDCKFVWAPNADYHLEGGDGYTQEDDKKSAEVTTSGSSSLNGGVTPDDVAGITDTYYLWTIFDNNVLTDKSQAQQLTNYQYVEFKYEPAIQYYVAKVNYTMPTYDDTPSVPILISTNNNKASLKDSDKANIDISYAQSNDDVTGQHYHFSEGTYNLYEDATAQNNNNSSLTSTCQMYPDNSYVKKGADFTLELGYNPKTHALIVISYDAVNTDGTKDSFTLRSTETTSTIYYYELDDSETNCVLVNPDNAVAFSTVENFMKSVAFKEGTNDKSVLPHTVTKKEQFTVEKIKAEKAYNTTYKFRSKDTDEYIVLNGTEISTSASATAGTAFYLAYCEGIDYPVLKNADGYCLVFENGVMKPVAWDKLNTTTVVTVYTGVSYQMNTEYTGTQDYEYYSLAQSKLVDFNVNPADSTVDDKLYTSTNTDTAADTIGTKIADLTLDEETGSYTAKVIMRVWVEGTDVDAKTPLANGIFNLQIHFTNDIETTETTETETE